MWLRRFKAFYWRPYIKKWEREEMISNNVVIFDGYARYRRRKIQHLNWGDDLNYYFFTYICQEKFVGIPYTALKWAGGEHYLLIGSVLNFLNMNNSIIYGSGIGNPSQPLIGKPIKVLSVRGPKTRKRLLENEIECPEKYGDPALLLSLFYKPEVEKKDIISIIPNEGTMIIRENNALIKDIVQNYGCSLINPRNYNDWREVVDKICESKLVVSESLHGLIAAETYGIPSVWVEFIEHPTDWDFKFLDFYESIGKFSMESIKLYQKRNWEVVTDAGKRWKRGSIDYKTLLEIFPFKIKNDMIIKLSRSLDLLYKENADSCLLDV